MSSGLAVGRAGDELGAVGHDDLDEVIVGMDIRLHGGSLSKKPVDRPVSRPYDARTLFVRAPLYMRVLDGTSADAAKRVQEVYGLDPARRGARPRSNVFMTDESQRASSAVAGQAESGPIFSSAVRSAFLSRGPRWPDRHRAACAGRRGHADPRRAAGGAADGGFRLLGRESRAGRCLFRDDRAADLRCSRSSAGVAILLRDDHRRARGGAHPLGGVRACHAARWRIFRHAPARARSSRG